MFFQNSIGIDIRENSIIVLRLKSSFKGIRLVAHNEFVLQKKETLEQNLVSAAEFVGEWIDQDTPESALIHLGIPRSLAILKFIELPFAVKENLGTTLKYEMDKHVPIPVDDIDFDYQILEADEKRNLLRVLLVVVKKKSLRPYLNFIKGLGQKVLGVEITSSAFFNCFCHLSNGAFKGRQAFVGLTSELLEIGIVEHGLLTSSRSFPLAEYDGEVQGLIESELHSLVEVSRSEKLSVKLFPWGLTRDGDLLKQLGKNDAFDIEIMDWTKAGVFSPDQPSPEAIVALGLALKGLKKLPLQINLLPFVMRRKPDRAGLYFMAVFAVLAILSCASWGGSFILHQKMVMEEMQAQIKTLGVEVLSLDTLQKNCRNLEERVDFLNNIKLERVSITDTLKALSVIVPKETWLQGFTYSEKGMQIEGTARSASEMISLLEASPLFKDVVFMTTIRKDKEGNEKFKIGLKVEG
ncbi:GspL [Desulforapulum autotrophicum HRM2]|uniref:GspL n=1 Tax=Desulforapulum autotrophicum (strain ATCC 43914 / DSM 3382 / VKM B-1955 / HRM2) TaxID=177437 RepID=C0QK71_DESAH|nr:PilN domain-containing protein [Desulforapulum autotrophicum]ACN16097.1 GspL [Desulforapulum autotrophicum HRM2]